MATPIGLGVGLTDKSSTIASGGVAQILAAANKGRSGLAIYNASAGDLWISFVGTAAAAPPSIKILSGAYYETPAPFNTACSIFGATTSQAFTAWEW